jgi:hypothetical protein
VGYFWEIAKDLPADIIDHPFYRIIERAYSEAEVEEREAFLAVKTSEAIDDFAQAVELGLDAENAREQALAGVLPDSEPMEEWEIADAEEEQSSIAGSLLAEMGQVDFQALALQPGVQKVIGGKTYVLNRNHRWTLPEQAEAEPARAPQRQNQPPQRRPNPAAAPQPEMPLDQWKAIAPKALGRKNEKKWRQYVEDAKLIDYIPDREPTQQEAYLAEQPGDSMEQRRARMVVARDFLAKEGLYYDFGSKEMRPLDAGRVAGMLEGIDFAEPVVIGPPPSVPPPQQMGQWQAPGGLRGGYFAPVGATPAELGLGELSVAWGLEGRPIKARVPKTYRFPPEGVGASKLGYIRSTAAPIVDNWGVEGFAQPAGGGGTQWFIPMAANPQVSIDEVPTNISAGRSGPPDRSNAAAAGR